MEAMNWESACLATTNQTQSLPFSTLQNQNVQCHVKDEAVSLNSLIMYAGLLTMSVEKKVQPQPYQISLP